MIICTWWMAPLCALDQVANARWANRLHNLIRYAGCR